MGKRVYPEIGEVWEGDGWRTKMKTNKLTSQVDKLVSIINNTPTGLEIDCDNNTKVVTVDMDKWKLIREEVRKLEELKSE